MTVAINNQNEWCLFGNGKDMTVGELFKTINKKLNKRK